MSFPAKSITDKVCVVFEKLSVDAKSARYYNGKCVNDKEKRNLWALFSEKQNRVKHLTH